jgi:hypothetical protein
LYIESEGDTVRWRTHATVSGCRNGNIPVMCHAAQNATPSNGIVAAPKADKTHSGGIHMAKKSRGGRMTAAKKRAAKRAGGKGLVKNRAVGRKIMRT